MDAAYDATSIWEQSRELGHVAITDRTPPGQEIISMAPREAARYNQRTAVERYNGRFKVEFGGRCVQVRGADKGVLHLMFGIISMFAGQLLKVTDC